jgi:hypothetical protein
MLPLARKMVLFISTALVIAIIITSIVFLPLLNPKVPIIYAPHSGTLVLSDSLHGNSGGDARWIESKDANESFCQFLQGTYHVSASQKSVYYCTAGATNYGDFVLETRMTILHGDLGCLIFRADGEGGKFYLFRIGRDGSYGLYTYVDGDGAHARTLARGLTPAVHTGLNIANVLAVAAHGNVIDLYVNGQQVTSVKDSTYSSGQIGLAATDETEATEVAFSDMKVWTL